MSGKQRDEDDAGRMLGAASAMRGRFGPDEADDHLLVEAADWLVRLMSRTATSDDAEQLAAWRAQSPAHDAAFREVAGVRDYAVVAGSTKKPMSRRALLSAGGGGALALVTGIGLARPPLGLWPSYAELTADHRTSVGGRLAIRPTAGVAVELSSRTAVSLTDDGHGIRLIAGETYVAAARQGRDFTVEAGRLRIAARDAEFNVQALRSQERVACVRGELRCHAGGQMTTLAANQAVSLSSDGAIRRSAVDAVKESAWRKGLLVFEGTPLAEVVDQINLHRSGRIVLTNSSLENVPLNAVFHIAQIENAVPQIEQLLNIHARHVAGGVVLLG
jgi:transmembrane sensor